MKRVRGAAMTTTVASVLLTRAEYDALIGAVMFAQTYWEEEEPPASRARIKAADRALLKARAWVKS